MVDDNKDKKTDDKVSFGCFIVVFILLLSGIPMAIKGEGPIGTLVIIIGGVAVSFYLAKMFSGRD